MGPGFPKREFLMAAYAIQKSFLKGISFFGKFDGTHIPKRNFLIAYISISKPILEQ